MLETEILIAKWFYIIQGLDVNCIIEFYVYFDKKEDMHRASGLREKNQIAPCQA